MPAATKEKLERAAERLVVARGFAATTARDLATEAGVPLGSVNYHYGSTDELLVLGLGRVIDRWVQEPVVAACAVRDAGGDGAAQLLALRATADRQMASAPLEAAAFFEALGLAGRRTDVRDLLAERLRTSLTALGALLQSAVGAHLTREQDVAELARLLVALRDGSAVQVLLGGSAPDAGRAMALLGLLMPTR